MRPPTARRKVGIVLAGGGSRGAYEAGIIRYLREGLPKRLGRHVPIDIVTGTSVGAINAAFMASSMDDPSTQSTRLVDHWRSLRIEELIGLKIRDVARAAKLMVADPPPPSPSSYRYGGILDTSGLERFVVKNIPWRSIERNLRSRALHAMSVSATHIGTGHTHVFLASADPIPRSWSRDPFVRHQAARIGPRHVLASAAIPLLFPAVKVGRDYYTDGGLRQNTPMSPAIRMGAEKMLLVSLRYVAPDLDATPPELEHEREDAFPRPLFLIGKALNALLLDHTEYDLDRMRRLNAIMEAGTSAFGPQFLEVMNRELIALRGAPLRHIQAVHFRPSIDIGQLASEFVATGKAIIHGRVARYVIDRLARGEGRHENDLLSYLLFDGAYASELITLGYHDAHAKEEELANFFIDEVAQVKP